jgi:hypothetical protein
MESVSDKFFFFPAGREKGDVEEDRKTGGV